MATGTGMALAQIDLERPGHDVCAQDVVGVALAALNGVALGHARRAQYLRHVCAYVSSYGPFAGEAGKARPPLS